MSVIRYNYRPGTLASELEKFQLGKFLYFSIAIMIPLNIQKVLRKKVGGRPPNGQINIFPLTPMLNSRKTSDMRYNIHYWMFWGYIMYNTKYNIVVCICAYNIDINYTLYKKELLIVEILYMLINANSTLFMLKIHNP